MKPLAGLLIVIVVVAGVVLLRSGGDLGEDGLVDIPAGPDVPLHSRFVEAKQAFYRNLVKTDHQASAQYATILDTAARLMNRRHVPIDRVHELHEIARRAARAQGQQTPPAAVLLAADMILSRNNVGAEERLNLLDRLDDRARAEHAHLVAMFGVARRAYLLRAEPDFHSVLEGIVTPFVAATTEPGLTPLEARVWLESVIDQARMEGTKGVIQVLDKQMGESPTADRWLRHMIGGIAAIDRAWAARGSGVADSVTPEGWTAFENELAVARDHLTTAWEIDPTRPEPCAKMITVTMGSRDGTAEDQLLWFQRAAEAEFDYTTAYYALLTALEPKWGGSFESMYAFGVSCEETNRYDTDVPWVLVEAVSLNARRMKSWEILDNDEIYQRVMKGLNTYRQRSDGGGAVRRKILSMITAFAWYRGEFETSRGAWMEAGGDVDEQYLGQIGSSLAEVRQRFGE